MDNNMKQVIWMVFYVLPLLLHSFGLFVLSTTTSTKLAINQKYYLFQISSITIGKSLLKIVYRVLDMKEIRSLDDLLWAVDSGCLYIAYIAIMILLTLDRFLEVYLNINYPVWATRKVTLTSIIVTWVLSLITAIIFIVNGDTTVTEEYIVLVIWPASEMLFLIVAITVYTYIFIKIRQNRKHSQVGIQPSFSSNQSNPETASTNGKQGRRRLRFYLPSLLILTFVLFWVVPDLVQYAALKQGHDLPSYTWLLVSLMVSLAMCSDAVIYLTTISELRQRVMKLMRAKCRWNA